MAIEQKKHAHQPIAAPTKNLTLRKILFWLALVACLFPFISPPLALLLGILVTNFIGNPYQGISSKASRLLLQVSVVGLGFGMNLQTVLKAGREGFLFTIVSIFGTLLLGYLLGKLLKIDSKTSSLISVGTAICGGSAIAAVSPVIKADEKQISVSLGTIFLLNSIALFIFPIVGHVVNLSQHQFGIWSAIAIHDTSSVVGAATKYGDEALQIATTVKLTRALWIIPIAFLSSFVYKAKDAKIKFPYFILLFVVAILLNTYVPYLHDVGQYVLKISKVGLTVTLFLIGLGLSRKVFSSVGLKPILQGVVLWLLISIPSLVAVLYFLK